MRIARALVTAGAAGALIVAAPLPALAARQPTAFSHAPTSKAAPAALAPNLTVDDEMNEATGTTVMTASGPSGLNPAGVTSVVLPD